MLDFGHCKNMCDPTFSISFPFPDFAYSNNFPKMFLGSKDSTKLLWERISVIKKALEEKKAEWKEKEATGAAERKE